MLVLLIIFMVITPMLTKGVSVDLVKTKNPITMQAADKEDAIVDFRYPQRQRVSEPGQPETPGFRPSRKSARPAD